MIAIEFLYHPKEYAIDILVYKQKQLKIARAQFKRSMMINEFTSVIYAREISTSVGN